MNLGTKNANDLMSKDNSRSKGAAAKVVDFKDIETFSKLCEKADFLFDFVKEKMIINLINAVNPHNLYNLFEFTKIYNADFEDFIVNSWVKFANEDLTDEILNLFEEGTHEQKAYAAAYFARINDTLAIEYLEKFAFDDFEPLAQNCARALFAFGDKNLFNKAVEIITDKKRDDFEKCKYINFLSAYGDKSAFCALYNVFQTSFMKSFLVSNILYLINFKELIEQNKEGAAFELFDTLVEAYPEEISLDTVFDFCVSYFVDCLKNKAQEGNSPYLNRLLLKTKEKFNLITDGDIYTYDLDKVSKKEVFEISNKINGINKDLFKGLEKEFENGKQRAIEALNIISNFGKAEFSENIIDLIKKTDDEEVVCEGVRVLKGFNKLQNVDKDRILAKIKNENIHVLINSYFE